MPRLVAGAMACAATLAAAQPGERDFHAGSTSLNRGHLDQAYRDLRAAAEAGHALAARKLGQLLDLGLEIRGGQKVEARPAEAARWYRMAADQGDAAAADQLGVLLVSGRAGMRDTDEAMRLFAKGLARKRVTIPGTAPERAMAAWGWAISVALQRGIRYPSHASRGNQTGRVLLVFDAASHGVTIGEADAVEVLRESALANARRALEEVPPPPEAVAAGFKFNYTIDYRHP